MSEYYQHAAVRLARLPAADRQWLYGQLSSEEREHLFELLSLPGQESIDRRPDADGRSVDRGIQSPEVFVARASPWQIAQAFVDEPDWVLALVISRKTWPWTTEYMEGLDDSRASRLRALAGSVRESGREAVYEAAVKGLADKIERVVPQALERKTLESGVAQLMNLRPVDD